jgi:hypothetical protein
MHLMSQDTGRPKRHNLYFWTPLLMGVLPLGLRENHTRFYQGELTMRLLGGIRHNQPTQSMQTVLSKSSARSIRNRFSISYCIAELE